MKIGFLMDDLRRINPVWETTACLMHECNRREHSVYFFEPHDLYIRKNNIVARMRNITVHPDLDIEAYWAALINCLDKEELIFETVEDLDVLFLRKDPPLNNETMSFLEPVKDKVFMINSIHAVLNCSSKTYILNFPDIIPETHVSRDPVRLQRIIDGFGGDMVLKPLHGWGGHGVIKVSNRDQENLSSLMHFYVQSRQPYPDRIPVMVQEYLKSVREEGDVRIMLLNGEIIGAMGRKSLTGDFRTNVHAGGKVFRHEVTPEQIKICERIKERLMHDGLYFVGIDVIKDKLVEINAVSPGGLVRINQLNNMKLESKIVDFIEEKINGSKHVMPVPEM